MELFAIVVTWEEVVEEVRACCFVIVNGCVFGGFWTIKCNELTDMRTDKLLKKVRK